MKALLPFKKVRDGNINEDIENTLKLRFLMKLHLLKFAEKKSVKKHNETCLDKLDSQIVWKDAIDEFPKSIVLSESQIDTIKQRKTSDTAILQTN